MSLLTEWREYAYGQDKNPKAGEVFWAHYFTLEKGVYEKLLKDPNAAVTGTVEELAKKFELDLGTMVGFLDGINESLKVENPIESMEKDTIVNLDFDLEKLYYNMIGAKATWLYELEVWDELLSPEKRKELYKKQKISGTVHKEKKIGRNDLCPCGSGKKYKKCCGATQ